MLKFEPNNEQISDGVNLLLSMLVRHPEIGTIKFDPQTACLKFKFMLSTKPSEIEFSKIKHLLLDSIIAYNRLEGSSLKTSEIELDTYTEVTTITVIRDIYSLSKNEITLLVTLLRENLKKYLIIDQGDTLPNEELLLQEEVMEDMLENLKGYNHLHGLIGIRESGRVLIFNK